VHNLWITLGVLSRWKSGLEHVKKEKKKETLILSKPYPIRAREEKRQAPTLPAFD
jgi:hypothetical protein